MKDTPFDVVRIHMTAAVFMSSTLAMFGGGWLLFHEPRAWWAHALAGVFLMFFWCPLWSRVALRGMVNQAKEYARDSKGVWPQEEHPLPKRWPFVQRDEQPD